MSKITAYLIDVERNQHHTVRIEPKLDVFYELLNCSTIDIVERKIGVQRRSNKHVYSIICDDEGLFKPEPRISAVTNLGSPALVGNLLLVGLPDMEGNETSLTPDDVEYIKEHIDCVPTRHYPNGLYMLTMCE